MRSFSVDISTNGGDDKSVAVSPSPLTIKSGDSVTFRDSNSGEPPTSIQITFPSNITCKVGGSEVASLTVPTNGSVIASLEGGENEENYNVNSQWGEAARTASPVIIIE
jgi:hypothetical protein